MMILSGYYVWVYIAIVLSRKCHNEYIKPNMKKLKPIYEILKKRYPFMR